MEASGIGIRVGNRSSLVPGVAIRRSLLHGGVGNWNKSRESEFPRTEESVGNGSSLVPKKESGIGIPSYRSKSRESEFPRTGVRVGNRSSLVPE